MKFICATLTLLFISMVSAQAADPAQAREVARLNNCPPKKIEVYQQSLGPQGQTTYRIDCNMPKAKSDGPAGATSILVHCDENLCELQRTLPPDSK